MRDDTERMLEATSCHFAGLIAITDPKTSWVAEWHKFDKKVAGCYCIDVDGEFAEQDISGNEDISSDEYEA